MAEKYNKVTWESNKTKLSPANLNRIEDGIETANETANSCAEDIEKIKTYTSLTFDSNTKIISLTLGDKNYSALVDGFSDEMNIENGTGTNAVQMKQDGTSGVFSFTDKNPRATEIDETLTGDIIYGGVGDFATVVGGKASAQGKRSMAQGTTTIAKGNYSHAEGDNTVALGGESHAEGYQTTASGQMSHSEGELTLASGKGAHAEGHYTTAEGDFSHASGYYTVANQPFQTVVGQFNDLEKGKQALFVVGNGEFDYERNNALMVFKDGHAEVQIVGETDESIVNKSYVNEVATNILEVAEGKSDVYVLSCFDSLSRCKESSGAFYVYNYETKKWENNKDKLIEGNFDSYTIINEKFLSEEDFVAEAGIIYLILRSIGNHIVEIGGDYYRSRDYFLLSLSYKDNSQILPKVGDIFLITEGSVPDRWYGGGTSPAVFYALESRKIDLDSSSFVDFNTVEVTYEQLKNLRDTSQLKPLTTYRLTDYITTTTKSATGSAGHRFDLLLTAKSANELYEEAKATHHEGDIYFQDSDLSLWEISYSLDNDKSKYEWADEENGKGVIFRLKDEFGNECPYDFKNIIYGELEEIQLAYIGDDSVYQTITRNNSLDQDGYYGWENEKDNYVYYTDTLEINSSSKIYDSGFSEIGYLRILEYKQGRSPYLYTFTRMKEKGIKVLFYGSSVNITYDENCNETIDGEIYYAYTGGWNTVYTKTKEITLEQIFYNAVYDDRGKIISMTENTGVCAEEIIQEDLYLDMSLSSWDNIIMPCEKVTIDPYAESQISIFILNDIKFILKGTGQCFGNRIGKNSKHSTFCTINGDCYTNDFGEECCDNIFELRNCCFNEVKGKLQQNKIVGTFTGNKINAQFRANEINSIFSDNIIEGNEFTFNKITTSSTFSENTIKNFHEFSFNTINCSLWFDRNNISDSFTNVKIECEFINDTYFLGKCEGSILRSSLNACSIGAGFNYSVIHGMTQSGDPYLKYVTIGNNCEFLELRILYSNSNHSEYASHIEISNFIHGYSDYNRKIIELEDDGTGAITIIRPKINIKEVE